MKFKSVFIIGLIWPEPNSSAAGIRMMQLISFFQASSYSVTFVSAAQKNIYSADLTSMGVIEHQIKLNDASFNRLLKAQAPDLVLFDRFIMEEQYGWRVDEVCPNALKVLDTEDLHCLRYARQAAVKKGLTATEGNLEFFTDEAKREIASILRCDVSLMISEKEIEILTEVFNVDKRLLFYLPFLEHSPTREAIARWRNYADRAGFVFIGNFLHEPNWHTLQVLKTAIWPDLKKKVQGAKLHIYGAYASNKVMQLHNEKDGFLVHGRAINAQESISKHKVLLAPIQFGAGVKGKFIDAMQTGTPSVTTTIGAEGMSGELPWPGEIADDNDAFIASATQLYKNQEQWEKAQSNGLEIINQRYKKELWYESFQERLTMLIINLSIHRKKNFMGQLLRHHSFKSTKYFSLWIEEKNKKLEK